jgi:hypothetical protein
LSKPLERKIFFQVLNNVGIGDPMAEINSLD